MKRILTLFLIVTLALPLFAFDFFFDEEAPTTTRNVSFTMDSGVQAFFNDGELSPYANLTLKAEQDGAKYRAFAEVSYDSTLQSLEAQEISLSLFLGPVTLKAGLMRHSWGTADTAHVVDIVNGRDLRKGIVDDLELMKRPDWMLTLSTYGENSAFDMVVKPGFRSLNLAEDTGRFSMVDMFNGSIKYLYTPSPGDPDFDFNAFTVDSENTLTLAYVSGGARYRFMFDPVNVGFMYYNGFFQEPGLFLDYNLADPTNPTLKSFALKLTYTHYHFIGIESSYFFSPFTLAVEGGMFLSEDKDGTDYSKYNSKLVYLAELSYTNPNNSFFLAFNYQGQIVLNYLPFVMSDPDLLASFNKVPYQNNFTLAMEYPFMREKMKVRVAGTYQLESLGYMALGSLTYDLDDAVEVFAKATVYGTFDESRMGLYNTWKENSQIQVGVRAWF
ncbi:MAG: hypothetical protein RBQ65_04060 [Sphaerochaeta sp.]|nr:hypothetical protein [Sphaerochaeta sp.]